MKISFKYNHLFIVAILGSLFTFIPIKYGYDFEKMSQHPAYTLGGLCALGGTAAFITKRSVPSLAGGLVFGSLYLYSGYLIHRSKPNGMELAFGTSSVLSVVMAPRLVKVKGGLPALLFSCGIMGSGYSGLKLYQQIFGV